METITTCELIDFLTKHPDREVTCRLLLGHGVGATHYWCYDTEKRTIMHTRDWPYYTISVEDITNYYGNCRWKIENI